MPESENNSQEEPLYLNNIAEEINSAYADESVPGYVDDASLIEQNLPSFTAPQRISTDQQIHQLRLPPHSVEAEQCILGAIMLDNQSWDHISDTLSEGDFYRDEHRRIFRQIRKLLEFGKPADAITVADALDTAGESDKTGGLAYLAEIVDHAPNSGNVRRYAEIVRERSVLRKLVATADDISSSALNPAGRDSKTLLDEAEAKIFEIAESRSSGEGFVHINPLLTQVIEHIQTLHDNKNPADITGVATGFADLDVKTAGLQPGDLVIVAGRPSMGKTAFALNIAEHVAVNSGLPVGIFSMEMGGSQLALRLLTSIGRLDAQKVRTGKLNDEEWGALAAALGRLHDAPIYIDETGGLNPLDLRARARRLSRQCGKLGLIVVDYIQLMVGSSFRQNENRATEISDISRSIKALAKELQVPIVALSQLSRRVEERTDKRPLMSDLRESGAIEQDADVVIMLYREEYYKPDTPDKGIAEVIIGKQRNGPTGTVKLAFLGEYTRFENLARF